MESQIKTAGEALQYLSENDPEFKVAQAVEITGAPQELHEYLINHYSLIFIARALRLEYSIQNKLKIYWTPDWEAGTPKYFCWFDMRKPSGSGFAGTGYGRWGTNAGVGSRLCFPTQELALYFGKTFVKEHKVVMFEPKGWTVCGDDFSSTDEKSEKKYDELLEKYNKLLSEHNAIKEIIIKNQI